MKCPECKGSGETGHRIVKENGYPVDHHVYVCSSCDGKGTVPDKCPECKGEKTIRVGSREEPDIITCPACNGTGIDCFGGNR